MSTYLGHDRMNPWQPRYADDVDGPDPFDALHPARSEPMPEHRHATAAAKQVEPDENKPAPALAVVASPEDRAVAALALTTTVEATKVALGSLAHLDPTNLAAGDIIEALNDLRGTNGIKAAYATLERELEDTLAKMLPRDQKRPDHAQKWTNIDGWRIERTDSGQWTIDSRRALERLFDDLGDTLSPELAADIVVNHISGIDTSWRTTELHASLGGPIERPLLDDDDEPVLLQRGPNKGQPKTEKINRLLEEEWGDRSDGRDQLKITKGDR